MVRSILVGVTLFFSISTAFAEYTSTPSMRVVTIRAGLTISAQQRIPGDISIIKLRGLKPNAHYTIVATLNLGPQVLRSQATFVADGTGVVETDISTPISGSYSKRDPDGLFWSMSPTKQKVAVSAPEYRFSVLDSGVEIPSVSLKMALQNPAIKIIDLAGTGLVGKLYLPPNTSGPRPAVIVVTGSEGGVETAEEKAAALANEGFVTMGIGYFGAPGLPSELVNVPLEYFQTAINYLKSRPEVESNKIAIVGPSRGGELSLLVGATFSDIKAVVACVPSPFRWGGNSEQSTDVLPSAWTFHGVALPHLNTVGDLVPVTLADGRQALSNLPSFLAGMTDAMALDRAMTEVEKINGPILLIGGEDDQIWPSCPFVSYAVDRLKAKKHPFADESVCYPNAGHGIDSIPFLPTVGANAAFHPVIKQLVAFGGTDAGNAFGQRDAWSKTVAFLKKNLK